MEGWIKLYRKFTDWEWYTDSAVKDLFIHLLLSANHQPKQWRGETIGVGETITSVASLAAETGLSTKSVRTALNKLEKTGEIERKATNRNSLIIVVNYSVYQSFEYDEGQTKGQTKGKPNGKQRANKGQTKGKPTNKNDKNDKNERSINIYGEFENVKLTADEYEKVKSLGLLPLIDELSLYIAQKGDKYKSHYATIRAWANRRKNESGHLNSKPSFDINKIQDKILNNDNFEID